MTYWHLANDRQKLIYNSDQIFTHHNGFIFQNFISFVQNHHTFAHSISLIVIDKSIYFLKIKHPTILVPSYIT